MQACDTLTRVRDQCASESTDLKGCSPCTERAVPSTTSSRGPPPERSRPQLPGARREQHEPAEQQRFRNTVRADAAVDAAAAGTKQAVATSTQGDASRHRRARLGVRSTAPAPRQRFVRIRRALMSRGDGVLVW